MENVFGKSATKAVYYHLRRGYLLKPEDILAKPEVFVEAIGEIFGARGAAVIEALLVKDLLARLGVESQKEEARSLADCFDRLKASCVKK